MRRSLPSLLLLPLALATVAPAQDANAPAPDETAALLLSPDAAHRERGARILKEGRGAKFEGQVLRTLARWATDREGWIEALRRRAPEASGLERVRIKRMIEVLKARYRLVSLELEVVAVDDEAARRILGDGLATLVSDKPDEWKRWRERIAKTPGAKSVFHGSAAGDDGEEIVAESNRRVAYVKDFEMKGKPGALVADPVVGQLDLQTRATWRPTLSEDERYVTLRLGLELADFVRPMPVEKKPTDTGEQLKVQVPEVIRARTRVTLTVPANGHAAWTLTDPKGRRYLVLVRIVAIGQAKRKATR